MARNLTTGLQRGLRRSIAGGLGASDLFSVASLDLRFAQTKALDSRITFTRASNGTYVGSDGLIKTATTNEARFDHNPTTGESLGLLVEEQRTNLLLRSEEFDNASWTKTRSTVTANATASPTGAVTADKLVEDTTATSTHFVEQFIVVTSGVSYTQSVYAKLAERQHVTVLMGGAGFITLSAARFDLSAGTATVTNGAPTASISSVGNGWYRCSITATATSSGSESFQVRTNNGTTTAYTGDGTSGIFLWGAQLEAGSFPTSYIPTTTATVTRSADVASITGANFSSWYNQTEGTVFADAASYMGAAAVSRGVLSIDGAANDLHRIFRQSDLQPVAQTITASVSQATFGFGATWNTSAPQKIAYAYATNNFGGSANGSTPQTDNSGTIPTTNTLNIGNLSTGNHFGGTIRRLTYWPSRLPNATLQQITR